VCCSNTDFGTPGRPNYFGLKPSEANFIEPKKKPLSSMSPMIVFRQHEGGNDSASLGSLLLVLGASGGPKIITAVIQVFINFAFLGIPLYDSVVQPRIHDQLLYHDNDVTTLEKSRLEQQQGLTIEVGEITRLALKRRRHRLLDIDYAGTVQAIAVDLESGTLSAVSDIRKGGTPAGY
jgi:gamma-glutamyltranspeptidase